MFSIISSLLVVGNVGLRVENYFVQKYLLPAVLSHIFRHQEVNPLEAGFRKVKMSGVIERLEKNAELAESLIADIYRKIEDIEKKTGKKGGDVDRLKLENERLRCEIQNWKELLVIRQIRNGKKQVSVPELTANHAQQQEPPRCVSHINSSSKSEATTIQIQPVKEEKSKESKAEESTGTTTSNSAAHGKNQEKKPKAESGAGKSKAGGGGKAPAPVLEEVVDVSRLDFRVGKIVEVEKHPDADTLYLEKVDVGEAEPRTVVSGLVRHVPIEKMQNRMVVLLCNLKPAKMRGIMSEAMVMCASTPEKVEILIPPQGAVPGDLVDFEGFTRNPDPVLNPKKKVFETVAPDLKTNESRVATYKGTPFEIKGKGVVTSESLTLVNIK